MSIEERLDRIETILSQEKIYARKYITVIWARIILILAIWIMATYIICFTETGQLLVIVILPVTIITTWMTQYILPLE